MARYQLSVRSVRGHEPVPSDAMVVTFTDGDDQREEPADERHWVFAAGSGPPSTHPVDPDRDAEVAAAADPGEETGQGQGGSWIIEAADLDEALSHATRAAAARRSPVEVRPIGELPESGGPTTT